MKTLQVYTDFVEDIEPLTDEEVGRLFRAMLIYAADDSQLPDLNGNERFTWATAKKALNRQWKEYREMCERNKDNRSKGSIANDSSRLVTGRHDSSRLDTTCDKKRQRQKEKNKTQSLYVETEPNTDDIKRLLEAM